MAKLALTLIDLADGVRGQRGRFMLSFLAVAVGVVALTLLLAVLSALRDRSERLLQELGADVVAVLYEPSASNDNEGLTLGHAELLRRSFPRLSVATARYYQAPTIGTRQQLSVVAGDEHLIAVRPWRLSAGRFLDHADLRDAARHAVISESLSAAWGWQPGNVFYVGETPFTVVGIVNGGGDAVDGASNDTRLALGDRMVIVPRTVLPNWSQQPQHSYERIDAMFIRANDGRSARTILPALQRILAQPDQRLGNVSWITPESLIAGISRLQRTITLVAGTIAALCLVLGGTTLMSLMVANVRDRVTEIGLRRAMGATRADIAALFVVEAALTTLLAGAVGTGAAHLLLLIAADAMPVPVQSGWLTLLVPPLVALLLGVVFSYWPARSAARITPAEALRAE